MEAESNIDKEARICALCKFNKNSDNNFFCENPNQPKPTLRHFTNYNDGCYLFVEKEERKTMYDI